MASTFEPEEQIPGGWGAARRTLQRRIAGLAGGEDRALLDDLVQEACVRLLRVARREPIDDPEALMTILARRTWIDHLRRQRRAREHFRSLGDGETDVADPAVLPDADLGQLLDRVELMVQEVFIRSGAQECLRLARLYMVAHDWKQVAAESGVGYAAIRKRWSRCLTLLRVEIGKDPDFGDLMPKPREESP
jgi:DNA-directed RNA polymerase specialized sigma24 family protein